MSNFVDLHNHILPGVDDGAPNLDTAVTMVVALSDLGFKKACATPHQRRGLFLPDQQTLSGAEEELKEALKSVQELQKGDLQRFGVAAENFWDEVLAERLSLGTIPAFPGGQSFLFELDPRAMPPNLATTLFRMELKGWLPVMAHPERYKAIQVSLDLAEELGRVCALQVDLGALVGAYGRKARKTSRRLLEEGLASVAASDLHKPDDARWVEGGIRWIRKRLGMSAVTKLLEENPRRILQGDLP